MREFVDGVLVPGKVVLLIVLLVWSRGSAGQAPIWAEQEIVAPRRSAGDGVLFRKVRGYLAATCVAVLGENKYEAGNSYAGSLDLWLSGRNQGVLRRIKDWR